jgi:hypothetical protein
MLLDVAWQVVALETAKLPSDDGSGTGLPGLIPTYLPSQFTSVIASLVLPPHQNLLPRSLETSRLPNPIVSFLSSSNLDLPTMFDTVDYSLLQQSPPCASMTPDIFLNSLIPLLPFGLFQTLLLHLNLRMLPH